MIGYYKIARHYKWALTQIFDIYSYKAAIIIEGIRSFMTLGLY
jgi:alpha-1,3-mannosyl-glycoprotein beta-1,2-N-acetylglucosaminyltransferase